MKNTLPPQCVAYTLLNNNNNNNKSPDTALSEKGKEKTRKG